MSMDFVMTVSMVMGNALVCTVGKDRFAIPVSFSS